MPTDTNLTFSFSWTEMVGIFNQRAGQIQAELDKINEGQPQQLFDETTFGPDTGQDD